MVLSTGAIRVLDAIYCRNQTTNSRRISREEFCKRRGNGNIANTSRNQTW